MARQIIEIPTKKRFAAKRRKLRVAAYCRVSTNYDEQLSSLRNQVEAYQRLIDLNPDWIDAGVYSDIGTGRKLKSRSEFQKLMQKCKNKKVDLIITKSISRFARNTLDALRALQSLSELGVDVWFEKENIWLRDPHSSFFLTAFCAFAQAESESSSENIKWGLRRSFQNPDSKKSHTRCYGYTHDEQGYLVIDPEQGPTVKLIFMLYYLGYSLEGISKELAHRKIASPRGGSKWGRETLHKMLSNEKYIGNVLLQKTYVADFFTGVQITNDGRLAQVLISNHHEGIVSEQLFKCVQQMKATRSKRPVVMQRNLQPLPLDEQTAQEIECLKDFYMFLQRHPTIQFSH